MTSIDSDLLNLEVDYLVAVEKLTTACAELLLYGIHVVLFILALRILARRKTAGKKVLRIYTVVMALFGTAQVIISVVTAVVAVRIAQTDIPGGSKEMENTYLALNMAQYATFWFNNLVSDSLLFYRCFIIWGSRWPPVVLPGILIAATFTIGFAGTFPTAVVGGSGFYLAGPTNLILVVLTAGRICWIRRDAMRVFPGGEVLSRYNAAITMLLESGTLYLIIITIILAIPAREALIYAASLGVAFHMINIAPTLIVVRVGLGHNIQDTIQSRRGNITVSGRPPGRIPVPPPQVLRPEVLHIRPSGDNDELLTRADSEV
ncbi:hypothetical protein B0H16DRAFT_1560141 [Mycena metata]|uniref:Uncharacterized protein n=1 Tax=Mycena metata TaxID=1033252 RepID=A0AAD7N3L4_9AGAR|nr:hypothetical protein B0H16DRAFT_1560141 [Mycena metata]